MTPHTKILLEFEKLIPTVTLALGEIQALDVTCKNLLRNLLMDTDKINKSNDLKIGAVLDYMKEKVNIGNWKDVPCFVRKTITITSFLRLMIHVKSCQSMDETNMQIAYKIVDYGIMFGWPLSNLPHLLQVCALILNPVNEDDDIDEPSNSKSSAFSMARTVDVATQCGTTAIDTVSCPSMEYFYQNYLLPEKPVILTNCMDHWPAIKKWHNPEYFIKVVGMRTVAVEVGNKYTDLNWTQKLMTIEEFIRQHIYKRTKPKGYLAQYQLFDQMPELGPDIVVPDYCCFSNSDSPPDVNVWYGPQNTVSPTHFDAKKNLFAQVVGIKQLYLFPPSDSEYLYPHGHEYLNNTAQVDPRIPDLDAYPKYKQASPFHCILTAGQMLYIPPKWWHFVESLSTSFSVSFWWN